MWFEQVPWPFPPETYGEPLASIETEFMYSLSNCRVERMRCRRGSKSWAKELLGVKPCSLSYDFCLGTVVLKSAGWLRVDSLRISFLMLSDKAGLLLAKWIA